MVAWSFGSIQGSRSGPGSRGLTARRADAGRLLAVLQHGSRFPRPVAQASLGRCPEEPQGVCRSPRGGRAGLEAGGAGRGAAMVAGSQMRRDPNARLPSRCQEVSAAPAACALLGRHRWYRMTSCLALREVVPFPNKSPARPLSKPTNQGQLRWWRKRTTFARNH